MANEVFGYAHVWQYRELGLLDSIPAAEVIYKSRAIGLEAVLADFECYLRGCGFDLGDATLGLIEYEIDEEDDDGEDSENTEE